MNSMSELSRGDIYHTVQIRPLTLSERDVAQLLEKSRFDPRLMEVMTEFIRDFWWNLSPVQLNKECKNQRSPFILKGITSVILDECEATADIRLEFSKWMVLATRGIADARPQLLYVGLFPIGSRRMNLEIKAAVPGFRRHGLFSKDLPFNKEIPKSIRSFSVPPENKVGEIDRLKLKLVREIKDIKTKKQLSNDQLSKLSGINRVYLSKLLNNKINSISVEYLMRGLDRLRGRPILVTTFV